MLGFEKQPSGTIPGEWDGGPKATIFADNKIVHGGHWSARLERDANSESNFSTIQTAIPVNFGGTTIEMRGFIRTEDVSGFAGLWLREDGDSPSLAFDNMEHRQLKGTNDWAEYSIKLPLNPNAQQIYFGFLVAGTGKGWVDDIQLFVDGKPIVDSKPIQEGAKTVPQTVLDSDHQFDHSSGITINILSQVQIDNLVVLSKVWGFLKYHHPLITSGKRHWDYDLFRELPIILAANNRAVANAAIVQWIADLGQVPPCKSCVKLDKTDLYMPPDLDWISNTTLLGPDLSQALRSIYANRSTGKQFYVSLKPNVQNPSFDHELNYYASGVKFPDFGFQLLAVYRFWNIVEYWAPYRNIIGEDWNQVLAAFIPRVALAKDFEAYQRELMALIAMLHDTHANLWSSLQVRPPVGNCQFPISVRFIENSAVVDKLFAQENPSSLKLGDVVETLDGTPVSKLVGDWAPYYADSNQAARLRDIARYMTRGACGDTSVDVERGKQTLHLTVKRVPYSNEYIHSTHDLPGPTFRLLSKDIAYLKLSSAHIKDAPQYIHQAAGTKGMIIDIRNYPSEFMVFALGSLLIDKSATFTRFTNGDLSNPGAFYWTPTLSLSPAQPHYNGKIVILVDKVSQSQAEYTTMAFRSAHNAIVVGSTTAGADGNVSQLSLPGGLSCMISGIGVFYPDKSPTQRIGIVPNVTVRPTIEGIRDGRDEVLEEGVRQILGPKTSSSKIQELLKPNLTENTQH